MTHRRYPAYKDSGIEWLGEVPKHWGASALRHACDQVTDGAHISPETENGVYPFVSTKDVREDGIDLDGCLKTTTSSYEYMVKTGCRPQYGDVLFSKDGTIGRTVIVTSDAEFVVASSLIILRPDSARMSAIYLNYSCKSKLVSVQVDQFVKGAGLPRLSITNLLKISLILPPLPEQQAITSFLDRETAKIDGLVAEQERLIELLTEKRQAVISHAVTRGLDPSVPLKDSGVEWLGKVPEHWDVRQLKRDLEFLTSGSRGWAEHYSDDGALFLRIGNLTRNRIGLDLSDIQRVNIPEGSEGERTRVASGDLLFSITAYLGSVAVVPSGIEDAYVSQHVALAKIVKERLFPEWLGYLTLSIVGQTYLANQGYGGTKVQLSLDDIACLPVLHPPLPEQQAIAAYLDEQTARFDDLMAEARRGIELLKERRTALISAAVTGKIDVREAA